MGLAAACSAGSGAPLDVIVAVMDGFGAGLSCGGRGVGRGVGGDLRRGLATRSSCRRRLFTYVTVADAVVFAEAPTARLSVAAVDGRGKPADVCHRGETGEVVAVELHD